MLDRNKVGLILGSFMALIHFVWALLVVSGLAQVFMDFIYSIHFLSNPFTVTEFKLTTTLILIVVTFLFGYLFGWVFAELWDVIQKKK